MYNYMHSYNIDNYTPRHVYTFAINNNGSKKGIRSIFRTPPSKISPVMERS